MVLCLLNIFVISCSFFFGGKVIDCNAMLFFCAFFLVFLVCFLVRCFIVVQCFVFVRCFILCFCKVFIIWAALCFFGCFVVVQCFVCVRCFSAVQCFVCVRCFMAVQCFVFGMRSQVAYTLRDVSGPTSACLQQPLTETPVASLSVPSRLPPPPTHPSSPVHLFGELKVPWRRSGLKHVLCPVRERVDGKCVSVIWLFTCNAWVFGDMDWFLLFGMCVLL